MADLPSAPGDRVSLPWRLTLASLHRLPQGALSRLLGLLADTPLPRWLRGPVLGTFARIVGIQLEEVDRQLVEFQSVNAFFVRRLARGVHQWPEDPGILASPVDGVVGEFGRVESGQLLQAKGMTYTAAELLDGDDAQAAAYEGGLFITIYLSPRHYHRIHTPMPGHVVLARHVPGRLLPVNGPAMRTVDRLFSRNERLICTVAGAAGPIAVVAVGAYNVGRISAAFDPSWSGVAGGWITNRGSPPPRERRYRDPVPVPAGSELMAFHLGSTVVLLTPPGLVPVDGLAVGDEIRAGNPIAMPVPDVTESEASTSENP